MVIGCRCRVHVVFGHVIKGQEVVRQVERQIVDENSRPLTDVRISSCGELVLHVKPTGRLLFCLSGNIVNKCHGETAV